MTDGARVAAVRAFDFTERQAGFLGLVLEHSGVCLPPAYARASYARFGGQAGNVGRLPGIAHGRQAHRFFDKLITGGFATTDLTAPAHAGRIYHAQYRPWHRAIGQPDHPHRRTMSAGRAVDPSTRWCPVARSGQGA
jgi:hypothetical protein